MERNKSPITSKAEVASAVRAVYEIVKTLKLSRQQMEDMVQMDVLVKIPHGSHHGLEDYCQGLVDALITVIIREQCEFKYRDEAGQLYSLERHHSNSIYKVNPEDRAAMDYAHLWSDTEFEFTAWANNLEDGL